jgi:DNA-binding response OmpR family regulator
MTRPRILLVEDDDAIADAAAYALARDGMHVTRASTLEAARAGCAGVDLVVLDLGLPDGSGYTLLAEWRRVADAVPVIVLTSHDAETDCVACLEAGADDFVAKPFSPRMLVARVRAVMRRRPHPASTAVEPRGPPVPPAVTPLAIDGERRTVSYEGRSVALTKTEFDLLSVLAEATGRVLTRDQLVARVWGEEHALTERTVDSHIKAVRRKLAEAGAGDLAIVAVRGVGFKLAESPGESS